MTTRTADIRYFPGSVRSQSALLKWARLALESCAVSFAAMSEMPFLEHLEELRRRILKCAIAVGIALLVCLNYSVQIIDFALRPILNIPEITLITNEASEIYVIYFEVAFAAALCLAMPVILWQIWQFIAPGLYRHEKRFIAPFILLTTVSFLVGAIFAYRVLVPASLVFSVQLASLVHVKQLPTVSSYLG